MSSIRLQTRLWANMTNAPHASDLRRRNFFQQRYLRSQKRSLSEAQWSQRSKCASSSILPKYLSSLSTNDADVDEKQDAVYQTTVLPKLDLLSAVKASPFQAKESSPSEMRVDAAIENLYAADHDVAKKSPKPSLIELLKTDLFDQSWSGPDTEKYKHRGENHAHQREGREVSNSLFEVNDRRSWDTNSLNSSSKIYAQPSPERTKLDIILQESNELLESLSKNDGSSTLQLMHFDSVMTKLSRFNEEMDNKSNDYYQSERSYNQSYGENISLKREASHKCAELLHALEQNYDCILQRAQINYDNNATSEGILSLTKHSQLMPNAASYNITLHTLAHSEKGNKMAMEASAILDRMIDRCRNYLNMKDDTSLPLPPPEPTIITFNSIIHAIAKSGADNAGHMAEEVFSKMEDWNIECKTQNRCYTGVSPNSRTLACVLDAWTNRDDIKGFSPERAESILNMAINRRRAYVKSVIGDSYDSTFSESGESDSFIGDDDIVEEYAEEDLESKQEVVQEYVEAELRDEECCGPFLRPNAVAFNTCINAWATCGRGRVAAVRTQELLRRMEAISESGELDLPYTDIDCDIDNDGSTLVDHSLRPNLRSYALVMKAWANVAKMERWSNEDAAEQCEAILNRMEKRGASDVSVRPNLVAYVTTITAWSRTKIDSAASRAEAILNRMVDLYYDGDKFELPSLERELEHAKHDAPFNSVITAYARSSDPIAAERAFAVLERLEVSPIAQSVFTYNAVMDVCAKHGEPERALQVLERMRDFSVTPDATSYDTVLNAFARHDKSGSAERAWELLREFDSRATGFVPSRVSYSAVINGFARAAGKEYGGMHAVKKAKEVYDRLIEQIKSGEIYGRADPVASSCFLNCCANIYGTRSERREALILAIKAFEDMKKNPLLHGDPGQYTFGTMMKACARLSSDAAEKNRLLESLFVQSCKRGFLSKSILGQFLRHTPNQFSAKVILNMGGSKREIPSEWHRNVPGKHKPIRTEHDIR